MAKKITKKKAVKKVIKKATPKKVAKKVVSKTQPKNKVSPKNHIMFETFCTDIKIESVKGREIYIENIFIYKQYGFENVKDILNEVEEPVNRSKNMTLNVDGESNDFLNAYLRNLSFKGSSSKSEDEVGYFYDVIFEDFEGWDDIRKNEYTNYLKSLLKFEFEYDELKKKLKEKLIYNAESADSIEKKDSFIIIKFVCSDPYND